MQIQEIYSKLKSLPGTNDKINFIKNNKSPLLEKLFSMTYDPIYSYYIKSLKLSDFNVDKDEIMKDENIVDFLNFLQELNDGNIQRGNVAKELTIEKIKSLITNKESLELLLNILNRDLKVGINIKTINKALNKDLIDIPPYMRCASMTDSNFNKLDWTKGIIVQEKADGMFINIIKVNNIVTVRTRQGTVLNPVAVAEIINNTKDQPNNSIICGEMLVTENDNILDRKTGNGYLNSLIQNGIKEDDNYSLVVYVWDIYNSDFKKEKRTYKERFDSLCGLFSNNDKIKIINSTIVHNKQDAFDIMKNNVMLGKEGVVIKSLDAMFKNGTSKDQIKLKVIFDCDLEIVEMTEGLGRNKDTFGSLLCKSSDEKLLVNVSGFSDKQRKDIADNFDNYKGKIITVSANEVITSKGNDTASLFLPRFLEMRLDKTQADSFEDIIKIFKSIYS